MISYDKLKSINAISVFLNRFSLNNFNAILLVGQDEDLAKYVAKLLVAKDVCTSDKAPCLNCASCLKVLNSTAVDVLTYPMTEKKELLVADAVGIVNSLLYVPLDFDQKYYIINGIDNANNIFQNKILKSVEEPPKFVKFVATCKNLSQVLPTIKSRFQQVSLPVLSKTDLKFLFEDEIDPKKLEIDLDMSNGSLTAFNKILNNESFLEVYEFCLQMLEEMSSSANVLKYSSKIVNDEQNFELYLFILKSFYGDLLNLVLNKESFVVNCNSINRLKIISKGYNLNSVLSIINLFDQTETKLKSNCNKTAVIDNLLVHILEVKYNANRSWRKI